MTKGKRFAYYFFGFGIGCLLVWLMLIKDRKRDSWTPNGRVVEAVMRSEVTYSSFAKCKLDCINKQQHFSVEEFFETANVNFKESATRRKPYPEYLVENEGMIVRVILNEKEEEAKITDIQLIQEGNLCSQCK